MIKKSKISDNCDVCAWKPLYDAMVKENVKNYQSTKSEIKSKLSDMMKYNKEETKELIKQLYEKWCKE